MSDARTRERLRRAALTGSDDDRARALIDRLRVGEIDKRRLELAAFLGAPGARAALGWREDRVLVHGRGWHDADQEKTNTGVWLWDLMTWGQEVVVRAALESSEWYHVEEMVCSSVGCTGECHRCVTHWTALQAARSWLKTPDEIHTNAALIAYVAWEPPGHEPTFPGLTCAWLAGTSSVCLGPGREHHIPDEWLEQATQAIVRVGERTNGMNYPEMRRRLIAWVLDETA